RLAVQLMASVATVGCARRELHERAHLTNAAVDALAHPVAEQFWLPRSGLQLVGASMPARGADALLLCGQGIVGAKEGGAAGVVAAGAPLVERPPLPRRSASLFPPPRVPPPR